MEVIPNLYVLTTCLVRVSKNSVKKKKTCMHVSNPNSWFQGTASGLMTAMSLLSIYFAKSKMSAEKGSHMEMHWRWKPILLVSLLPFSILALQYQHFFFMERSCKKSRQPCVWHAGLFLVNNDHLILITCLKKMTVEKNRPKYLTALIYSEGNHRRIKC